MDFRRTVRFLSAFFVLMGVFLVFSYGCNDVGLDADFFASVTGELHIDGAPPAETDEVLLALMDGLTPRFTKSISRRELDLSAVTDTLSFTLEAKVGEFDALFAIWKQRGKPVSVIENIVGSSCQGDSLVKIVITEENRNLQGIPVDINLKKVHRIAGVSGVIQFSGDWPNDLENLGIVFADSILAARAIFNRKIDVCNLLKHADIHFLPTTPTDSLSFEYDIAPGRALMVVAWTRQGQSIFEPEVIIDIFAGGFIAIPDSTVVLRFPAAFD